MPKLTVSKSDFSWTFAAFAAVGLSGLVINQVIATQLGVTALGRYNMLLAVVIIGGQIGPRLQGKISQRSMEKSIGYLFLLIGIAMSYIALRNTYFL